MDRKEVKAIADTEVKAHEKRMHPGAKKMRAGGKTNSDMLKYGRNMAKVMNQRSPGRKGA
jgi:hypothetical protein